MDELVALTDAAGAQDRSFAPLQTPRNGPLGATAAKVAERVGGRHARKGDAADLGLSRATVTHHLRRLGVGLTGPYIGRRAIVATLGGSGVRGSELCDMRIRDLRLHAASGGHFHIPDAKTEAGIREVQVSPDLLDELNDHLERLRRAGHPTEPESYLFPNARSGRTSRQRVARIIREAAVLASAELAARGLPELPNTTPHTLRRTYISIALLANKFDVLWVMRQVGHADSKMTMDVYAQLQQRAERQHGEAFDALVRRARRRLYGTTGGAARIAPGDTPPGRDAER
jgi:integrase